MKLVCSRLSNIKDALNIGFDQSFRMHSTVLIILRHTFKSALFYLNENVSEVYAFIFNSCKFL